MVGQTSISAGAHSGCGDEKRLPYTSEELFESC
jgi:hypothetical protein